MDKLINKIHNIDALNGLKLLPDRSINCFCSSPPYWACRSYLRNEDTNKKYELGQESTFTEYIDNLILIFKEVYRVLRDDGCCFVNLGDTYYGGGKGAGGLGNASRKQRTNTGSYFDITGTKFQNNEIKDKCLCNIPYRFAIKMTDELGWTQRNQIIWYKRTTAHEALQEVPRLRLPT